DAVILVAALPAENQRQKYPLPVARHELLPLECQVAVGLALQGGINRIAARDKLVEPEGERRTVGAGVALAAVTALELFLDRLGAAVNGCAREARKFSGGTVRTGNASWPHAHQPVAARLRLHAKGALDPDGERVVDEAGM